MSTALTKAEKALATIILGDELRDRDDVKLEAARTILHVKLPDLVDRIDGMATSTVLRRIGFARHYPPPPHYGDTAITYRRAGA